MARVAAKREWRRLARLRKRAKRGWKSRSPHRRNRLPPPDTAAFENACGDVKRLELTPRTIVGHNGGRQRVLSLPAPADFRFKQNPEGILRFIYEMRRQWLVSRRFGRSSKRRPGLYVDLDPIVNVDIEGALMLAAEFDRLRRVLGFKPTLYDHGWNSGVRAVLYALGLYGVTEARRLFVTNPIVDAAPILAGQGIAIVPFLSGSEADGAKALELREALYETCEPPGAARRPVYDALVEAFTNAVTHAYPRDVPGDGLPQAKRWWAGALVDKAERILYLVVYDQGVGIPATLKRRDIRSLLSLQMPELSDAAVIKGALDYGRSGTGQSGRGNGLWRMCELTNAFPFADVTFTSLKGVVTYTRGGKMELAQLETRFTGTMIVWRAQISEEEAIA